MSSRRAPDNNSGLKPVQKIELSERRIKLRIVLVVLFIVIALAAFAVGIIFYLSTDAGWRQVEASAADTNCSQDFIFYYEIQNGGLDGTAENRAVATSYGEAAVEAYRIFNPQERFDGLYNLAYLNENINTKIEIDATLYNALALLESYGNRTVYLGPVYAYYYNIFYSPDEANAAFYDPYKNEDMAEYFRRVAEYANDGESINIELYGNNTVMLSVSEEYQQFAKDNAVDYYLDFFVLKNAFIIDYLAESLIEDGFTKGIITSYDGYTRTLGEDRQFSIDVLDKNGEYAYIAGTVSSTGCISAVRMHNYSLGSADHGYNYGYSDGTAATAYVDPADGLYKSCINDLIGYSRGTGCAELMLNLLPVYIADEFNSSALSALKAEKGIYSVYCADNELIYNDKDLIVTVTSTSEVSYSKKYEE